MEVKSEVELGIDADVSTVVFDPTGKSVAVACKDGKLRRMGFSNGTFDLEPWRWFNKGLEPQALAKLCAASASFPQRRAPRRTEATAGWADETGQSLASKSPTWCAPIHLAAAFAR